MTDNCTPNFTPAPPLGGIGSVPGAAGFRLAHRSLPPPCHASGKTASARSPKSLPAARRSRSKQASSSYSKTNLGPLGRRQFLQSATSSMIAAAAGGESLRQAAASTASPKKVPWPKPIGSPVLDSLPPVIENSRDVHTNVDKLSKSPAGWPTKNFPCPNISCPWASA